MLPKIVYNVSTLDLQVGDIIVHRQDSTAYYIVDIAVGEHDDEWRRISLAERPNATELGIFDITTPTYVDDWTVIRAA